MNSFTIAAFNFVCPREAPPLRGHSCGMARRCEFRWMAGLRSAMRIWPVERRATGQIRIADRNPAIHRNSQRLAIPHEWPRKGGASRGQTKLNAAMVNEFIGIARRSPLCEVGWRANNGHLHRSRYTDGYHALSGTVLRAYPGVETLCDKVDRRVAHVQLQLGLRVG